MSGAPRRVLVIRIDKVGDLILATPAIRNLRDAWPAAHLAVLVSEANAAVLQGWAAVDERILYDRAWSVRRRMRTVAALRVRRFDAVVVLSPLDEAFVVAFLTGAAVRCGVVYSRQVFARFLSPILLSRACVVPVDEARARGDRIPHEVEQSLMAIEALGITARPVPLELAISPGDREWADTLLAQTLAAQPAIVLHLSDAWFAGGGDGREMRSLLQGLLDGTPAGSVLVTYGAADGHAFEALVSGLAVEERSAPDGARVHGALGGRVVLVGGIPFARWAALLSAARVVISRDTGALHTAAAVRRPVVAVYEDRTFAHCSQQWAPWMVPHRSLRACDWAGLTRAITAAAADLWNAGGDPQSHRSEGPRAAGPLGVA